MASYLITGASTGIGAATALHLADAGHRVLAGVRRDEDGDALCRRAGGGTIVPVLLDVTDDGSIERAVGVVDQEATRLAGVVNNAGIARAGPLEYQDPADIRATFDVNVFGAFAVTQAFLPKLRADGGRVVFVGSISGTVATPMVGTYCGTKAALDAMAAALRMELAPWGLHVSVIEPGPVKTPIWDKAVDEVDAIEARDDAAEVLARYGPMVTRARWVIERNARHGVTPERVALAVERALTAEKPRFRYRVGIPAHAGEILSRLLPDRVLHGAIVRAVS